MGNATSHNSIFISWNPPATEDQNGVITGYTVNVTSLRSEETQQFFLMAAQNLSVDSLTPHTTYSCKVAAHTAIGAGPFSQEILVQTLQTGELGVTCCIIPVITFRTCSSTNSAK